MSVLVRSCVDELKRLHIDNERDHPAIRVIGQKLSDDGYVSRMREACDLFMREKGDGGKYSLQYIWDGAGYWHA